MNLVGMLGKMVLSNAMSRGGGGGGNLLGSLLGGGQSGGGMGGAGGLGGLLGGLTGGQAGAGAQQPGGMLGQILGGQAGGAQAGGLGGLLGQAMGMNQQQNQQQVQAPAAAQNDQAAVMIRAMVNAAKSDGEIDQQEQQNIVGKLGGDVSAEEAEFIRNEMAAPLDVNAFARTVPQGMEQQVYLISLMAINLDNKAEAVYLDQLAKCLNINEQQSNQLHAEIGVPQLYS